MSRPLRPPPPVLITLNIGNTTASAIVFRNGIPRVRWSAPTSVSSARKFRDWVRRQHAGESPAALSSVVPAMTVFFRKTLRRPLELHPRHEIGVLKEDYPGLATLGVDRVAAICGAAAEVEAPFIVMDAGTAMTFNAVVPRRGFMGGAIAPGPGMFYEYLAGSTSQLPHLRAQGRSMIRNFGRTTRESMQLGAEAGFAGMTRGILERLLRMPELKGARLLVTGGGADIVRRALRGRRIRVVPDLLHRGLLRAWMLNGGG